MLNQRTPCLTNGTVSFRTFACLCTWSRLVEFVLSNVRTTQEAESRSELRMTNLTYKLGRSYSNIHVDNQ